MIEETDTLKRRRRRGHFPNGSRRVVTPNAWNLTTRYCSRRCRYYDLYYFSRLLLRKQTFALVAGTRNHRKRDNGADGAGLRRIGAVTFCLLEHRRIGVRDRLCTRMTHAYRGPSHALSLPGSTRTRRRGEDTELWNDF